MPQMKHRLEFLNPVYHFGLNVTVRRGRGWLEKARVGDIVEIYKTGTNAILATGIIEDINYVLFLHVRITDLLEEHDPECRTPHGLVHAMLRAYPEFQLTDKVTVIRFAI